MKDFFEAAVGLIDRSWHIALAVAIGCFAALVANAYGLWPMANLETSALPWIGLAGILGAAIVVGHIAHHSVSVFRSWRANLKREAKRKRGAQEVKEAVQYLTAQEKGLLRWILVRDRDAIECAPYNEIIAAMVRKGVLTETDYPAKRQVYRVHPIALGMKKEILSEVSQERRELLLRIDAPLNEERRRPH